MNIKGKRVVIRAIERGDLEMLQAWSNDPEIQSQLGGWHFPSSMQTMEDWLERVCKDTLNQRFAIEATGHGLIGTCNLVDINWKDRNAFHGILLGSNLVRGKGFGQDTVMAIMRYSFDELGLERLDSSIIEFNEPSKKLYIQKCGWKEEGRKRNAYWRNGRFWDKLIVGINRDDYLALVEKNRYWQTPDE